MEKVEVNVLGNVLMTPALLSAVNEYCAIIGCNIDDVFVERRRIDVIPTFGRDLNSYSIVLECALPRFVEGRGLIVLPSLLIESVNDFPHTFSYLFSPNLASVLQTGSPALSSTFYCRALGRFVLDEQTPDYSNMAVGEYSQIGVISSGRVDYLGAVYATPGRVSMHIEGGPDVSIPCGIFNFRNGVLYDRDSPVLVGPYNENIILSGNQLRLSSGANLVSHGLLSPPLIWDTDFISTLSDWQSRGYPFKDGLMDPSWGYLTQPEDSYYGYLVYYDIYSKSMSPDRF